MDAHDIVDGINRHAEKCMHESGTIMQPDYVGKPDSVTGGHVSLVLDRGVEDVPTVRVSDALLLRM
jgi:hypothetical protein